MDETREDRMRSRMRGAARHQVQNADFGDLFTIPLLAPEPEPEPEADSQSSDPAAPPSPEPAPAPAPVAVKRTDPNTSAKRRRLDSEGASAPPPPPPQQQQAPPAPSSSANRSSRRHPQAPVTRDPYDLDNAPGTTADEAEDPSSSASRRSRASSQRVPGTGKSATPRSAAQSQAPIQSSPLSALRVEEVGESPADAPGSGHRRRVRASGAVGSSALLQSALRSVDNDTAQGFLPSSSPLSRKSGKRTARTLASARSSRSGLRRSTRLSGSPDNEVNELSSDLAVVLEVVGGPDVSEGGPSLEESVLEVAETVVDEPTIDDAEAEDEHAQETNDREAAQRLGRKRPRRLPSVSPGLSPDDVSEELVAKRSRKERPPKRSPAKQRQPKVPRAKPNNPAPSRKRKNDIEAGPPVPVKVQRYTRVRRRGDNDSSDEDILNSDIPHANRAGVNAVDFLAQVCEKIINSSVDKTKEGIMNAEDAATKKELRVKLRALEAFQEGLRTRLLEHTIAIDTLYSLKKRVREAQREKLKLRERIIQIRAEREQVALRMDAVRTKYDEDSKQALHNINLSTAMHNFDLAIEQGRAAPELSAIDQKTADLANLELMISRVVEQACSSGPGGGALKQIKSFNAFLERAAVVL